MSAAHVQVNVTDFTGVSETNVSVRMTYLNSLSGTSFITPGPRQLVTGTDGTCTFSNLVAGYYQLSILSSNPVPAQRIILTNYDGIVSAAALTTTTQSGGSSVSWTANAADLRFFSLVDPDTLVITTQDNRLKLSAIAGGTGGITSGQATTIARTETAVASNVLRTDLTSLSSSASYSSNAISAQVASASNTVRTAAATDLSTASNALRSANATSSNALAGHITTTSNSLYSAIGNNTNSGLTAPQVTNVVRAEAVLKPGASAWVVPWYPNGKEAALSITWDDDATNVVTDMHLAVGFPCTFSVHGTNFVEWGDRWRHAATNGNELANHGWYQAPLLTQQSFTSNQWWSHILDGALAISNAVGAFPTIYNPAYGATNAALRSVVTQFYGGMRLAYTTTGGFNSKSLDRYSLGVWADYDVPHQPLDTLYGMLTNAVAQTLATKSWGIPIRHRIDLANATNSGFIISSNDYGKFLAHLTTLTNRIHVGTLSSVIQYEQGAAAGSVRSNWVELLEADTHVIARITNATVGDLHLQLPNWDTNSTTRAFYRSGLSNLWLTCTTISNSPLVVQITDCPTNVDVTIYRDPLPMSVPVTNGISYSQTMVGGSIQSGSVVSGTVANVSLAGTMIAENATISLDFVPETGEVGKFLRFTVFDEMFEEVPTLLVSSTNVALYRRFDLHPGAGTVGQVWTLTNSAEGSGTWSNAPAGTAGSVDTNLIVLRTNGYSTGQTLAAASLNSPTIADGILDIVTGGSRIEHDGNDDLHITNVFKGGGVTINTNLSTAAPITAPNVPAGPASVGQVATWTGTGTAWSNAPAGGGGGVASLSPIGITNSGYVSNFVVNFAATNTPLIVLTGATSHFNIILTNHAAGRRCEVAIAGASMAGWSLATNLTITWQKEAGVVLRWAGGYTPSILYSNQWALASLTCLGGAGSSFTNVCGAGAGYE